MDNGFRPAGLIRLSTTTGTTPQYLQDFGNTVQPGNTTHSTTLYRAPSGALVFSAGTVQWTWGLDQEHDGDGAPADPRMQQAQINLLADMGAQPATRDTALSPASASSDTAGPAVTVAAPAEGATIPHGSGRHGVRNGQRHRRHRGRRRSLHGRRNQLAPGPGQAELDLHLHPEGPRHGQHQGACHRRQRQYWCPRHPQPPAHRTVLGLRPAGAGCPGFPGRRGLRAGHEHHAQRGRLHHRGRVSTRAPPIPEPTPVRSGVPPASGWRQPPSQRKRPSGWQEVRFSQPVAVSAGQKYVVSYYRSAAATTPARTTNGPASA